MLARSKSLRIRLPQKRNALNLKTTSLVCCGRSLGSIPWSDTYQYCSTAIRTDQPYTRCSFVWQRMKYKCSRKRLEDVLPPTEITRK